MKVLLIAPYADRDDVGEARSTWFWVDGLSRRVRVDVLTCSRRGRFAALEQSLGHVATMVGWEDAGLLSRLGKFNSMAKPGLLRFARRASRWAEPRLRSGEYDLVHQISPLAPRHGPLLARTADVPFILGPLAGSIPTPRAFRGEMSEPWYVRLRAVDGLRFRHDPWLRARYEQVSHVVAVAPYMKQILAGCYSGSISFESEVGVSREASVPMPRVRLAGPLRLLFVGRLIRSKGIRDLVAVVLRLPSDPAVTLDIVGEGPERGTIERMMSESPQSSGRITVHGRVPRSRVDEFYQGSDVFVFPSFREPSGNVVIEAMASGLPVVTASGGGPEHAVGEGGIVVPSESPSVLQAGLERAIINLAKSPATLAGMSSEAMRRVDSNFIWSGKIDRMLDLYRMVCGR